MIEAKELELSSGEEIPVLGFGTWNLPGDSVKEPLRDALELGYTHVDTAEGYHNEAEIGEVLEDYDRERLFLTSKVLPSNLNYDSVLKSCNRTLENLGTSYLDLYLIHWPNPAISVRETLAAFEKLHEEGKVKSIGVSNFSLYQLKVARKVSDLTISVNQVEFHPWYHDENLLEYCREHDIRITASAPLARTEVLDDELVRELAEKYGKTPAQIVLRWQVEKGVITVPKSSKRQHIEENGKIFDFELDLSEVESLDDRPKEKRIYMIDLDDETYGIPA